MINPCHPYPPPFGLVAAYASSQLATNDRALWFHRGGVWAFESAFVEPDKSIRLAWFSFAARCHNASEKWTRYVIPSEGTARELIEIG